MRRAVDRPIVLGAEDVEDMGPERMLAAEQEAVELPPAEVARAMVWWIEVPA